MGEDAAGRGAPRDQSLPLRTRQAWEVAEAQVFQVVMVRPDLYERSVTLVRLTVETLRRGCVDVPSLLAAEDRAGEWAQQAADAAGVRTAELRLDLIASAALAMRYREIAAEQSR